MRKQLVFLFGIGLALSLMLTGVSAAVKPVVDAASRGDTETVRQLLRDGADVNETQGDGMTALHWAADRGDTSLAEILIYAGSNLDAGTRIGHYTPLHIASRAGHTETVKALLNAGANVDASTTNSGAQPLHLAATSGNAATVSTLLDGGAEVHVRERAWGQTPLVFAAAANRVGVMNVLLDAGADPAVTTFAIDTVIMEKADKAAEKRITEFLAEFKEKEGGGPNWSPQPSQVQAAIEASREIQRKWPDVPDPSCDEYMPNEGEEAGATRNKCTSYVTYNADGEPVYDYADDEDDDTPKRPTYGQRVGSWGGLTPLLHAVRQGHAEATYLLLERGVDIDQVSAGDNTSPLLMAAVNGQFDLALNLIERGADPNLASAAGTTPLFAVLERRWASRASYAHLIEHQQQRASHLDVMQALLDAGAGPNVRLNSHLWYSEYTFSLLGGQAGVHYKGATPFWRATLALDVDAMQMLKEHGAHLNVPTVKLPDRRRRQPSPAEVAAAEAKKTLTIEEQNLAAEDERLEEEIDHSGIPEVPVGGSYIYPIHAASGAGYGQWFAGNAHQHAPDNWLRAVKFLVEECGADVNIRDANAYTPLHHAASRGDNEVVQYLIDNGADVTVVSRKGQTTADMANGPVERVPPYPETIALLEKYGAKNSHNCVSC